MKITFHTEAENEFNSAIDYYEGNEIGLGYDFATEVYNAIRRAVDFPEAWPTIKGKIRRTLVNRFPFGVMYSVQNGELYITAIMHLHRNPDYWKHRM